VSGGGGGLGQPADGRRARERAEGGARAARTTSGRAGLRSMPRGMADCCWAGQRLSECWTTAYDSSACRCKGGREMWESKGTRGEASGRTAPLPIAPARPGLVSPARRQEASLGRRRQSERGRAGLWLNLLHDPTLPPPPPSPPRPDSPTLPSLSPTPFSLCNHVRTSCPAEAVCPSLSVVRLDRTPSADALLPPRQLHRRRRGRPSLERLCLVLAVRDHQPGEGARKHQVRPPALSDAVC
jgi:hypothetical protein